MIGFSSYFDGYEATFQYDVKGQLTDADYFGIAGLDPSVTLPSPEDYSFDANGNRGSSAAGEHNRVSSNAGSQFQYDEEGNQLLQNRSDGSTRETFFDHRNRLVQVINRGVTIHYQYDAFDRRTGREVDRNSDGIIDERTVWIWDGQQVVLQQIDADGDAGPADFEATNRYLYGASVDQLLADEQLSVASPVETTDPLGGPLDGPTFDGPTFDDPTTNDPTVGDDSVPTDNVLWALTDHLGSVRDLIDSSGTRREHIHYDTFGIVISETDYDASGNEIASDHAEAVDTLFGYTGREWDEEAELQFNRARWYDPEQGRWLSQDPIGFTAGDANLYRYVGNGSTSATDPSGLARRVNGVPWSGSGQHVIPYNTAKTRFNYFDPDHLRKMEGVRIDSGNGNHNNIAHGKYGYNGAANALADTILNDFKIRHNLPTNGKIPSALQGAFTDELIHAANTQPQHTVIGLFNREVANHGTAGQLKVKGQLQVHPKIPRYRHNDRGGFLNYGPLANLECGVRPETVPRIRINGRPLIKLGGSAFAAGFVTLDVYDGINISERLDTDPSSVVLASPLSIGAVIAFDDAVAIQSLNYYSEKFDTHQDYFIDMYFDGSSNGLPRRVINSRARSYIHGQLWRLYVDGKLSSRQEFDFREASNIDQMIPIWTEVNK